MSTQNRAPILVYGANGYTGELIMRAARARNVAVIAAGRSRAPVEAIAALCGSPSRIFDLSGEDVARHLEGVSAVLHCAGPFSRTWRPMVEACLAAKVSYLDVTGEISVFESIKARARDAEAAGIALLPGAGFDVVPSDCLAAHLAQRLPSATHLVLAFRMIGGGISHGTMATVIENLPKGASVRESGRLIEIPNGERVRSIDFGRGPTRCAAIQWGDLSTGYTSTGIPNIEVYTTMPRSASFASRLLGAVPSLAAASPVQRFLQARARNRPRGPNDEQRAAALSLLWGEVRDGAGGSASARLQTPEGYTLTAETALTIAERIGELRPGYHTPATAFGPDFILGFSGVTRTEL